MGDCGNQALLILVGQEGDLEVDGILYNGVMPPQDALSDAELATVITYVRNSWGNKGPSINPDAVKKVRAENTKRSIFWKVDELLKDHPLEK